MNDSHSWRPHSDTLCVWSSEILPPGMRPYEEVSLDDPNAGHPPSLAVVAVIRMSRDVDASLRAVMHAPRDAETSIPPATTLSVCDADGTHASSVFPGFCRPLTSVLGAHSNFSFGTRTWFVVTDTMTSMNVHHDWSGLLDRAVWSGIRDLACTSCCMPALWTQFPVSHAASCSLASPSMEKDEAYENDEPNGRDGRRGKLRL